MNKQDCPNIANHTPTPDGYIEWHDWTERAAKVAEQKRCDGCGLWAIWEPKPGKRLPKFPESTCLTCLCFAKK